MAKIAIVLAIIIISIVTLAAYTTYCLSINRSDIKYEVTSPTLTPTPTNSPEPTTSPTPTPQQDGFMLPTPNPSTVISSWYWNGSTTSNDSSIVQIVNPINNGMYNGSTLKLTVDIGTKLLCIHSVYYEADWLGSNRTLLFHHLQDFDGILYLFPTQMAITTTLTNVPAGNHAISIYAIILSSEKDERGQNLGYTFTDLVHFTVNTPPFR